MIQSRSLLVAAAFVAASIAIAVWGYAVLPAGAGLPYHHGFGGPETGHLAKGYALALIPAIAAVVVAAMAFAPMRYRDRLGPDGNAGPYGLVMMSVAAVLCVTQVALFERMMSPSFDVVRLVFLAVAALLVVVGNYLGKVRYNGVFGIKTPWTLRNPRVWDKTHRVVARLMVIGGLGLVAACLFIADLNVLIPTMIALTAGPLLYGIGYSAREYRREQQV